MAPVVTRAERAMERGDYDTAIAGYAEALERTPWNTRLSTALVSAYAARAAHPAQSGRPGLQAAEADLRTALSIAPDDPSVQLHGEYPESANVARLLAQVRVRKGTVLVGLQDHRSAGAHFDGAVALYDQLGPCDGSRCDAAELRTAHRNRVIAWLSAYRVAEARLALDDAERAGLVFPDLNQEVRRLEVRTQ